MPDLDLIKQGEQGMIGSPPVRGTSGMVKTGAKVVTGGKRAAQSI